MIKKIIIMMIVSILVMSYSTLLVADDSGIKDLELFLDNSFKNGGDFQVDVKMIGRIGESIVNTDSTFYYKEPSLIKVNYISAAGFTSLVMDLNNKKGFYFIKDGDLVIEFETNKKIKKIKKGDMKEIIFDLLTEFPLNKMLDGKNLQLISTKGNKLKNFKMFFTPKFKSILKFVKYDSYGNTSFFMRFNNFKNKILKLDSFLLPKGKKMIKMSVEANNPFEYINY
jgi:outer membrane lipoprotein-sorting protein